MKVHMNGFASDTNITWHELHNMADLPRCPTCAPPVNDSDILCVITELTIPADTAAAATRKSAADQSLHHIEKQPAMACLRTDAERRTAYRD